MFFFFLLSVMVFGYYMYLNVGKILIMVILYYLIKYFYVFILFYGIFIWGLLKIGDKLYFVIWIYNIDNIVLNIFGKVVNVGLK